MSRVWRNPAVSHWRKYNPNPVGRSVGDCAVRAVAAALDVDWETAYAMIANNGFLMGDMPSSNTVWGAVLRMNGFTRHTMPNTCPDCYTLERFAEDHPEGTYVVCTGNHVATVIDGWIWDAWDSSNEIVAFYWQKED